MRHISCTLLSAVAVAVCSPAAAAPITITAELTPDQVVPLVPTTTQTATATLTFNDDQTIDYLVTLGGIDIDGTQTPGFFIDDLNAVHIHLAPPGQNGPLVFGIFNPTTIPTAI